MGLQSKSWRAFGAKAGSLGSLCYPGSQRMAAPSSPPTALMWPGYFYIDDKLSLRNEKIVILPCPVFTYVLPCKPPTKECLLN